LSAQSQSEARLQPQRGTVIIIGTIITIMVTTIIPTITVIMATITVVTMPITRTTIIVTTIVTGTSAQIFSVASL
jgi:hypothetical protein